MTGQPADIASPNSDDAAALPAPGIYELDPPHTFIVCGPRSIGS